MNREKSLREIYWMYRYFNSEWIDLRSERNMYNRLHQIFDCIKFLTAYNSLTAIIYYWIDYLPVGDSVGVVVKNVDFRLCRVGSMIDIFPTLCWMFRMRRWISSQTEKKNSLPVEFCKLIFKRSKGTAWMMQQGGGSWASAEIYPGFHFIQI